MKEKTFTDWLAGGLVPGGDGGGGAGGGAGGGGGGGGVAGKALRLRV